MFIPPYKPQEPNILYSFKSVNDFAEKIHYDFNLTNVSGEDKLIQFVENLGGKIVYDDELAWHVNVKQALQIRGENDFTIHFSKYSGPLHDRFVIAHELGHYFIHSQQGKIKGYYPRKSDGIAEFQANWFACGLLMPTKEFLDVLDVTQDEYTIAGRFMVPTKAVEMRKKQLKKNGII